jgi:hypothetical protein
MTLSGDKRLEFQAELFLRSLDLFGGIDYVLTICQSPGEQITNLYIKRIAEVIYRPQTNLNPPWYACLSCVPEKGDVTVYTDADIMILGNLAWINSNGVCGVIAYSSPEIEWKRLYEGSGLVWRGKDYQHSVESGACPFYVNLGFVSIPSSAVPMFNDNMKRFLYSSDKVYPGHYHRPQFAMCLAAEKSGLRKVAYPVQHNYPDLFNFFNEGAEKATVAHLLQTKSEISNWKDVKEFVKKPPRNKVVGCIQDRLKKIMGLLI